MCVHLHQLRLRVAVAELDGQLVRQCLAQRRLARARWAVQQHHSAQVTQVTHSFSPQADAHHALPDLDGRLPAWGAAVE